MNLSVLSRHANSQCFLLTTTVVPCAGYFKRQKFGGACRQTSLETDKPNRHFLCKDWLLQIFG